MTVNVGKPISLFTRVRRKPFCSTCHDLLELSVRIKVPALGTKVRPLNSSALSADRTPSSLINKRRLVGWLTLQTTPSEVAEVRVNPPSPSIDLMISFLNGLFAKTYSIP